MHGALLYFRTHDNGKYTRFGWLGCFKRASYLWRCIPGTEFLGHVGLAEVCPVIALVWYRYIGLHGKVYKGISSTFCRTSPKH